MPSGSLINRSVDPGQLEQLKAELSAAETKAHEQVERLEESPSSLPRLVLCLCALAGLQDARERMAGNG